MNEDFVTLGNELRNDDDCVGSEISFVFDCSEEWWSQNEDQS